MSRLARGASFTMAARVAALILGVASSVIVARALGPAGKGEYALIVLIPALLQLAGGLGLGEAMVYLIAQGRDRARQVAVTLTLAAGALGVALIALYFGISRTELYLVYLEGAGVDPPLVWILIALLPISLAGQGLTSASLALERYRDYNLATLIPSAVTLLLLLVLVVGPGLGVGGAVSATAAGSITGLVAAGAFFFAAAPPGPVRPAFGLVRQALSFGGRVHAGNLAWFIHYRADMFLVGFMAGPAALGFYSTAVGLVEKLYVAPSAIGTVLFPRLAAADEETARGLTPRASRHTLFLTVALAVVLAMVAHPVIRLLYGAEFLPSVLPLWILLPGVVSLAVGRVVSADLNGRGLPGVVAKANMSMAAVNVLLNLWWIPIWGVAGAAAATSLSYSVAVVVLAHRYRQASGVRWSELVAFGPADWAELRRALGGVLNGETAEAVTEDPG